VLLECKRAARKTSFGGQYITWMYCTTLKAGDQGARLADECIYVVQCTCTWLSGVAEPPTSGLLAPCRLFSPHWPHWGLSGGHTLDGYRYETTPVRLLWTSLELKFHGSSFPRDILATSRACRATNGQHYTAADRWPANQVIIAWQAGRGSRHARLVRRMSGVSARMLRGNCCREIWALGGLPAISSETNIVIC